jgi:acetylornithine/N-succinyldiaminopimelate aminotransferase
MTDPFPLVAQQLAKDPRIAQAKALLTSALEEHQRKIQGVRPPNPALKESYEKLLQAFTHERGNKLFFPYIGSGIGRGALVELMDGSVKYDFITGIGPHFLGHSHPDTLLTGVDAALSDVVMQGNLQQNADALEFSQLLSESSGMPHCFLTTTGAMANENALKVAFHKNHPASRILAFDHCFVGRTLASSQITDKAFFREGLPINLAVDYLPFFDSSRPEQSIKFAVDTLKKYIKRYPKQHAIMILELVLGEGGFYDGSHEFFMALIEILKDNHIAVFADEVQTFGRTSRLFAFQHFGLDAHVDIVSVGKLSQTCATLFRSEYNPNPGLLSQTFTGSTASIRAGTMIIKKLLNEGYFGHDGRNMHIHQVMVDHLEKIARRHPCLIEGPYGIGVMIAFTPFDGNNIKVNEFVQKLFEAGVMGFVAGSDPTRVRFLVPFGIVTDEDIAHAMKIVENTLTAL